MTTRHPASASACAVARPNPADDAATSAPRPSIPRSMALKLALDGRPSGHAIVELDPAAVQDARDHAVKEGGRHVFQDVVMIEVRQQLGPCDVADTVVVIQLVDH